MLNYRLHRRGFSKIKRVLLALIIITVTLVMLCERQIAKMEPEYIKLQAEILAERKITEAVENTLKDLRYNYNDLAQIKYAKDGSVQAVETDSLKINDIKARITSSAEKELSKIYSNELPIPLGAFTGVTILSNYGPPVTISFNLTGSFSAEIVSTLEDAGINQTVHHIRLILKSNLMTTSLDYSGEISFSTDYEIAQSVIVGKIPTGYGNPYLISSK